MCNCNNNSEIKFLCTPTDISWSKCPEKLRYTRHMILNNLNPDGKIFFHCEPIKNVIVIREFYTDIMKTFNLDQSDVKKLLSIMRNDELDMLHECELDLNDLQYNIDVSNFENICEILYKLSREQLESLRSFPILHGFIEEALGNYDNALIIFHTDALTYGKLYGYLAYLYEYNIFVLNDDAKFFEYSCEFHKYIDDLQSFIRDLDIRESYDSTNLCNFIKQSLDWKNQNKQLIEENKQLRERIIELEYAPGGVGYQETKDHFEKLVENQ